MSEPLDWTGGQTALTFQRCRACGETQYLRRPFCRTCGANDPETVPASGRGTVYAVTTVTRAPSAEWKALAPYGIALVDAEEGFRFMAHAAEGLAIGDAVTTTFREVGQSLVPLVQSTEAS